MTHSATFVWDDAIGVPAEIAALTGIHRFGVLLHERKRLADHADAVARSAGFAERRQVSDRASRLSLAQALADAPADARFVYATADVVGSTPDVLGRFLAKLGYADRDVVAAPRHAAPGSFVAAMGPRTLAKLLQCGTADERRAFLADRADVEAIPGDELLCLSDPDLFTAFLSGSFYTRAFNTMRQEGRTIRKRSADRDKMRKEHDFWYLLPPSLQRFVVQPFDLEVGEDAASYRMERLHVPDMAVLWVHGPEAVPEDAFAALLDALFDWLSERPRKRVAREEARAVAEDLYVRKVEQRMDRLLQTDEGKRLDALLATSGGGLRDAVATYRRLLDRAWADGAGDELAVTHGDLCFSNVLFDKRSRLVKLIDPRGASVEKELWSDPYYDVAKLSHSILGGYDFLNHGLFEVVVDEKLGLQLRIDRAPAGAREALFLERLREAGYDETLARLYEASLFLSMLPLHAEAPRKVLGFALNALRILEDVEKRMDARRGGWVARMLG